MTSRHDGKRVTRDLNGVLVRSFNQASMVPMNERQQRPRRSRN